VQLAEFVTVSFGPEHAPLASPDALDILGFQPAAGSRQSPSSHSIGQIVTLVWVAGFTRVVDLPDHSDNRSATMHWANLDLGSSRGNSSVHTSPALSISCVVDEIELESAVTASEISRRVVTSGHCFVSIGSSASSWRQ
jgi:hypothetical protein